MLTTFPTPEEFRQWLQQHEPTTIIAHDWNCYHCPLANFLAALTNTVGSVGIDPFDDLNDYHCGTWWFTTNDKHHLPEWAALFANKVDDEFNTPIPDPDTGIYDCKPITAADCLRILDEVTDAKDNINN